MSKAVVYKMLISFIGFLLGLLSLLFPAAAGGLLGRFALPLVSSMLTGLLCGPGYGALTGALARGAVFLITAEDPEIQVLSQLLALSASGFFGGWFFRTLRMGTASAVLGLLAGALVYGFTSLIGNFLSGRYYSLTSYLQEVFLKIWPGILVILILLPLLARVGLKKNLFRKLENQPMIR